MGVFENLRELVVENRLSLHVLDYSDSIFPDCFIDAPLFVESDRQSDVGFEGIPARKSKRLSVFNNRFVTESLMAPEIGQHRLRFYQSTTGGLDCRVNLVFGLLEFLQRNQTPGHPDPRFRKRTQRQSLPVFLNRFFVLTFVAERLSLLIAQRRFVAGLLLSYFQRL